MAYLNALSQLSHQETLAGIAGYLGKNGIPIVRFESVFMTVSEVK